MRNENMRSLAAAAVLVLCYQHHESTYFVQCLTIPTQRNIINHAAILEFPPFLRRNGNIKSRKTSRLRMSSTDNIDSHSDVLEDIDGIGQLTVETEGPSITTADSLSTAETQTIDGDQQPDGGILSSIDDAQLLDPAIVVEQVIGTIADPSPGGNLQEPIPALEERAIEAPSLRKILNFAVPAIGVWLCSPLLSLIDTSSVGLLSGTAQQAALNPAVAVTDYGCLLIAFMYTATTNLIASIQEKETDPSKPKTAKMLINAMQISVYVGLTLGTTLMTFARPLLRSIIGNDAIDPEVFAAAMRYVRIRSLGMPAAVVIGSAQSACLGMKDVRSPLYVLFAAAVVNFLGDMLFVGRKSVWVGGAAGAAWATVFSQYVALAMFFKWLTHNSKKNKATSKDDIVVEKVNLTNSILELIGKGEKGEWRRMRLRKSLRMLSSETKVADDLSKTPLMPPPKSIATAASSISKKGFSTRGFLAGRFSFPELVQFPARKDAAVFKPYFLPVTTTQVGRVSSYIAMSHVVSSALGTTCMAANQIIVSFFYCLTPIADSLNLTAQSFIPGIFDKKRSIARAAALKEAKTNFLKAGMVFSVVMTGLVAMLPLLGKFFTSDVTVLAEMTTAVPALIGTFCIHGVICAGEGLLLGQKDLGFLGKMYASYFFVVPYFMLRVKKAALSGATNVGLSSVWTVFMAYQFARCTLWVVRLSYLQRKTENALVVENSVQ